MVSAAASAHRGPELLAVPAELTGKMAEGAEGAARSAAIRLVKKTEVSAQGEAPAPFCPAQKSCKKKEPVMAPFSTTDRPCQDPFQKNLLFGV